MPPKKGYGTFSPLSIAGLAEALGLSRARSTFQRAVPSLLSLARGIKMAKKASATKTITKRKKLVLPAPVAKGEGKETKFELSYPPSAYVKNMKKTNAPNHVIHNFRFLLNWNAGRQNAANFTYFDRNQFNNILAQLPVSDISGNLNRRFLLDKFQSEVTFSNSTNASCYVHIYDIMVKQDMDNDDVLSGLASPTTSWNSGEIQQGNPDGLSVIGTDPKKIDLFKQHYKILQHTKHFMGPGDVHKHHSNINYNRVINESRVVNSILYGGYTLCTMIVAYGTPANDDAVPPVVSTTAGALSMTFTNKYIFRYSLDNQQNSKVINLLPTPANLEVVQDDGDIDLVVSV